MGLVLLTFLMFSLGLFFLLFVIRLVCFFCLVLFAFDCVHVLIPFGCCFSAGGLEEVGTMPAKTLQTLLAEKLFKPNPLTSRGRGGSSSRLNRNGLWMIPAVYPRRGAPSVVYKI